jgi:arabinogalactan endo-1,4-beta-galactosidase
MDIKQFIMKRLSIDIQHKLRSLVRIGIPVMLLTAFLAACDDDDKETPATEEETTPDFYFGADLSFSNQIVDHSGIYQDMGTAESPYRIFADHGTNLVRLRLWHNPTWTNDGYGDTGPLYSDLKDVVKSIGLAKEQGSEVLLDFHYSDTWADPGSQDVPAAWINIRDAAVLKDSV